MQTNRLRHSEPVEKRLSGAPFDKLRTLRSGQTV
jgi:hypothetical protein